MSDLINIRTFTHRYEAEMAKSLLEEKGIKATISTDDSGGLRSSLAFAGETELLIKKGDVLKANNLLNDFFEDDK